MEQSTLVAVVALIGSFATVLVTSITNYRIKKLESEQKFNEHKMSIRNTYVLKKIEAGEKYVSELQIGQYELEAEYSLIHAFKRDRVIDEDFRDQYYKIKELNYESRMNANDYTGAYFALGELAEKFNALSYKGDALLSKIDPLFNKENGLNYEDFAKEIDEVLEINIKLANINGEMITYIKEELAKYDIL
jgi:hypothetical protein